MKKLIALAVLAALFGGGYAAFGWAFPIGFVCVIFGLFLAWGLSVRYIPRKVGVLVNNIIKRIPKGEDGWKFKDGAQSKDWADWFKQQQKDGWKQKEVQLPTRWSEDVDPKAPLPEYPRPQLSRESWVNLNGLWSFNVVAKEATNVSEFPGQILVPFAIESALSGVQRSLFPGEKLWYQRKFDIPANWNAEERIVLNFGAVDWETTVLVNGVEQGSHQGGYTLMALT